MIIFIHQRFHETFKEQLCTNESDMNKIIIKQTVQ